MDEILKRLPEIAGEGTVMQKQIIIGISGIPRLLWSLWDVYFRVVGDAYKYLYVPIDVRMQV